MNVVCLNAMMNLCSEVLKTTETAKALYHRWTELIDDPRGCSKDEYDWTTNELRNSLRSIEWDLEDLEETISIVEKNPKKFKIEGGEVSERRMFVERTKTFVKEIKDRLSSPATKTSTKEDAGVRQSLLRSNGPDRPMNKYTRLNDTEVESANDRFLEDVGAQQQMIIKSQDDQLDMIGSSVKVLKDMSHHIGNELDEQSVMLDDFSREMETTETRMDTVMKKISKVLHMSNDRRQWIAIAVLLLIMLIVIALFFIL